MADAPAARPRWRLLARMDRLRGACRRQAGHSSASCATRARSRCSRSSRPPACCSRCAADARARHDREAPGSFAMTVLFVIRSSRPWSRPGARAALFTLPHANTVSWCGVTLVAVGLAVRIAAINPSSAFAARRRAARSTRSRRAGIRSSAGTRASAQRRRSSSRCCSWSVSLRTSVRIRSEEALMAEARVARIALPHRRCSCARPNAPESSPQSQRLLMLAAVLVPALDCGHAHLYRRDLGPSPRACCSSRPPSAAACATSSTWTSAASSCTIARSARMPPALSGALRARAAAAPPTSSSSGSPA